MTIMVQAGKVDCFFHKVQVDEIIDIEYQVIDSTHGDLDISFQLGDPTGRVIVADFKKPENSHRHTATSSGDYKFCFDNSFSDPTGRVIVADFKKPENSHRHTATSSGDYKFCFDNSFSTFSQKTVSMAFLRTVIGTDIEP
ncbi:hypothetical protein B5X24_HaOG216257 [Helicoverpa armigera]|uniref:GOLD domain-containing protein n=1 Tax=Helicoverpa armigera TaxID=29058 RepID=A0A2W1BAF4_HELAM|nr:hypothetical protein B5X24_HaOG216257 [Helicoverpa armigera]